MRLGVAARLGRIPAARKDIRHRGRSDGEGGFFPMVDAVLHGAAEMLVAGDVDGEAAAKSSKRAIARSLGPAVRIVIGGVDLTLGVTVRTQDGQPAGDRVGI